MTLYHATCVEIDGQGVLIEGPSGSGKSDLGLRLISRGARLVGDDYVQLSAKGGHLIATVPDKIAGKLEVRGVGLRDMDYTKSAKIALLITLVPRSDIHRLPEKQATDLEGIQVPTFSLHAFDASTPDKIVLILKTQSAD